MSSLRSRFVLAAALAAASLPAFAATQNALPNRVKGAIDNTSRTALTGTVPPRAMHSADLGAVSPSTKLQGITLTFSRSAQQQADLTTLIAAQQTPGSPQFHQWLTPAQFGARFGISDSDLTAVQDWLQSQGFTNLTVSPARERISFSGPEAAIETAFGTSLHFFRATSGSMTASSDPESQRTHVAPARDLTIPAALSGIVLSVGNLSDYRAQPRMIKRPVADFTSSQSGNYYLTPKDVAVIYDVNAQYTAGNYGQGQTIAVAGQSAVLASDIANFQTADGTLTNTPTLTLVPNTGSSTFYTGDQGESDLDLEYTTSIAQKASINFLYTGNNSFYGVFDSVIYGIDYRLANIITISYGECEPLVGASEFAAFDSYFQQAAAQGQTVISASGDQGSSSCYGEESTTALEEAVAVDWPASSAYVTALGGTEFPSTDLSSTYFSQVTTAGQDVNPSAKSYMPEVVWNDDAASFAAGYGPSASGGGASIYETRPSWQNATIGGVAIPSSTYRLVPDISLDASPEDAAYLYCSSDSGPVNEGGLGYTGSCTNGFRVATGYSQANGLTTAGGTSFAAPIFAGMLALLNEAKGYNSGQGLINTELYSLAANTGTYGSAFHDITSGTNACTAAATYCGTGTQTSSYAATTGYDEATGLGSVDLSNLISAWPTSTSGTALASTTTSVTAATVTPSVGATDSISITVGSTSGTPTGTVAVTDNGTSIGSAPLNGGTASFTYTAATSGVHTLVFTYGGTTGIYASSSAGTVLNVGNSSFVLSATSVSVPSSGSATSTVTVTPANGYTGTVLLTAYTTSSVSTLCFSGPASVKVTSSAPVSATYTIYSGSASCPSGSAPLHVAARARNSVPSSPWRKVPVPATLAGLLAVFGLRRRSKLLRNTGAFGLSLALVLMLGVSSLGLTGCSNGASGSTSSSASSTTSTSTSGSYNLTIYGQDSADQALTATGGSTITVTN